MTEDNFQILLHCPKVSAIKEPNLFGHSFLARVCYVVDGDTVVVIFCNHGILQRLTVRITKIDVAEISHTKSKKKVSEEEQKMGCRVKSFLLHTMLPDKFDIVDDDRYTWRVQQKIFDQHAILLKIVCPTVDSEGKPMKPDPYMRCLGQVSILPSTSKYSPDTEGKDWADLVMSYGFTDAYEGGKKHRSFLGQPTK